MRENISHQQSDIEHLSPGESYYSVRSPVIRMWELGNLYQFFLN